jgi:hypothetical protein
MSHVAVALERSTHLGTEVADVVRLARDRRRSAHGGTTS